MFRFVRIAILVTLLVIVAGGQFLTESRLSSWQEPLWVTIYPIPVGSDSETEAYVESLRPESFKDIGLFIGQQADVFDHHQDVPIFIQVASPLTSQPPPLPRRNKGIRVALWSLKMRWWVWNNSRQKGLTPADIKMFVHYNKDNPSSQVERSVGIQKGSYGVVNAVASPKMASRNRIIITHELLHILGASDKYDFTHGQPIVPTGLADPDKSPLFPQKHAEIMSGRIATSAYSWRLPASLKSCVIGTTTATEIGLLD